MRTVRITCAQSACGREREDALRFYERLGLERSGYSMRKAL